MSPARQRSRAGRLARLLAAVFLAGVLRAEANEPVAAAPWVEADFPFFGSVLDVPSGPGRNLTPRGVVLNLGHGHWALFDTELLRMAAIWHGAGVAPRALAPGSYLDQRTKTPQGQNKLPAPDGEVWLGARLLPGWQAGGLDLADPRAPAPSVEEVGRGPLPEHMGRFKALQLAGTGVVLEYEIAGITIHETVSAHSSGGGWAVERRIRVDSGNDTLFLVLGDAAAPAAKIELAAPAIAAGLEALTLPVSTLRFPARSSPLTLSVVVTAGGGMRVTLDPHVPAVAPVKRWPATVTTRISRAGDTGPYAIDNIELPATNPWRRRVRPGDIQFRPDGTGVLVTIDGDVWLAKGLEGEAPRWSRFASGLHEPMTLALRGDEIFVFDRNGIWRLLDTNGDDEADRYELFSNAFAQTADMREFPNTIRTHPDGGMVIAKGGQQATTLGKHNGSVLRISPDGRRAEVLGHGFRQPYIAVHPREGWVTASDQEGHYIPTTPLHLVEGDGFHGFLAPFLPKERYPEPIVDPVTWIPHSVIASALSQVWLNDARLGPLNGSLAQISFNQPGLFQVLFNRRAGRLQAAVTGIPLNLAFPPLNGAVNPADGQLYLAGFQILGWGNVNNIEAGLCRMRFTGQESLLPTEIAVTEQGVLLRFGVPLDREVATNPDSYSLGSWHYRRSHQYGSPQLKADGRPGEDFLTASSAYLSEDGRSVFVGVPGLKPVDQLRIGWSLRTRGGEAFEHAAFTTPHVLPPFNPGSEGFGPIAIDLKPRARAAVAPGPVSLDEGKRVATLFGCIACHAENDTASGIAAIGPSWRGLYGSNRDVLAGGEPIVLTADEAYLRESILEPSAKMARGYESGEAAMPSYAGVLTESQVESVLLYLKSLR